MSISWQTTAWEDKMFWLLCKCGTIAALWCLIIAVLSQNSASLKPGEEKAEEIIRNTFTKRHTLEKDFNAFSATFLSKGPWNQGNCFSGSADWKQKLEKKLVQKRCHQQPQSMMTTEHHYQSFSLLLQWIIERHHKVMWNVTVNCKLINHKKFFGQAVSLLVGRTKRALQMLGIQTNDI